MRKSQVKSLQRKKLKSVHQITTDPEGGPRSPPSGSGSGRVAVNRAVKASGWSGDIRPLGVPLTCQTGCSPPASEGPCSGPRTLSRARRPAGWSGPSRCGPPGALCWPGTPGLPAPASPLGGQQSSGDFPCFSGSRPSAHSPVRLPGITWPFPQPSSSRGDGNLGK